MRGEHKTNGPGAKINFRSPDHGWNVQTHVRSVELYFSFNFAIIQQDLETAACRHQELMALSVCVSAPVFSTGNIVEIKNPFGVERHLFEIMYDSDIAGAVDDFRQVKNVTIEYGHALVPIFS